MVKREKIVLDCAEVERVANLVPHYCFGHWVNYKNIHHYLRGLCQRMVVRKNPAVNKNLGVGVLPPLPNLAHRWKYFHLHYHFPLSHLPRWTNHFPQLPLPLQSVTRNFSFPRNLSLFFSLPLWFGVRVYFLQQGWVRANAYARHYVFAPVPCILLLL